MERAGNNSTDCGDRTFLPLVINSGKPKASRENELAEGHVHVRVSVNLLLATLHLSKGQVSSDLNYPETCTEVFFVCLLVCSF